MIGANFEVASLFSREALVMLPIFLVIAYIVKLIPCFFLLKKEFGILKSMSAGFLLSSRLSLIIALSAIALQSGVITNSMYSTLIIVAIITCLLSPVISMKLYLKSESPSGTEQIAAAVG
jgi:Kef-type K+ transport system membrane component KefB